MRASHLRVVLAALSAAALCVLAIHSRRLSSRIANAAISLEHAADGWGSMRLGQGLELPRAAAKLDDDDSVGLTTPGSRSALGQVSPYVVQRARAGGIQWQALARQGEDISALFDGSLLRAHDYGLLSIYAPVCR